MKKVSVSREDRITAMVSNTAPHMYEDFQEIIEIPALLVKIYEFTFLFRMFWPFVKISFFF